MRKSCVIYDSWAVQIISLPPEMAGEYTQKILKYAFCEEQPTFDDPALAAMFASVKARLDEDLEKYQAKVDRVKTISKRNRDEIERNRNDIGTTSNEVVGVNDNENVNVNVNDKDKKKNTKKKSTFYSFPERNINYEELKNV